MEEFMTVKKKEQERKMIKKENITVKKKMFVQKNRMLKTKQ
jgi:hypothetical protein